MLLSVIHDVEVQIRTFSWLLGKLGKEDEGVEGDNAYGLYLIGNMIADNVKAVGDRIREDENKEKVNARKK